MRFHIPGLSHTQTTREYSCCAFTAKVRLLCKMLHERGHYVIHYGVEGSDPACSENVITVPEELFNKVHRRQSWHKGFNLNPRELTNVKHLENCIAEIGMRKQPGDFLLAPFGFAHKPICDEHPDLTIVESGIGYGATFAPYRIFESYFWMAFLYGRDHLTTPPPWTDAVIPNYLDFESGDYPFQPVKKGYAIQVGRPTVYKGLAVTVEACKAAGVPLYVAGQDHKDSPDYTNLGVLSIEERAKWVGEASVLFAPTLYLEPFGTCTIEALAYGTPVITTDWGAFTETIYHGETGYRCRTMDQFVWALRNVDKISPARCREVAIGNHSLERVGGMYEEHFSTLAAHAADPEAWHRVNPERTQLDWLRRRS